MIYQASYPHRQAQIQNLCTLGIFVEDNQSVSPIHQTTSLVVCEEMNKAHDYEPLLSAVRHLLADGWCPGPDGAGPAEHAIRKQFVIWDWPTWSLLCPRCIGDRFQGMIFYSSKDRKRCNLALMGDERGTGRDRPPAAQQA
jgi:hypothetical protein